MVTRERGRPRLAGSAAAAVFFGLVACACCNVGEWTRSSSSLRLLLPSFARPFSYLSPVRTRRGMVAERGSSAGLLGRPALKAAPQALVHLDKVHIPSPTSRS